MVWKAGRLYVTCLAVFRLLAALTPVTILYVSKRIIDIAVGASQGKPIDHGHLWVLLGLEFALAAGSMLLSRSIDYMDLRLSDEFNRYINLRLMQKSASLDLSYFEDADFYDKLERARAQASDRIGLPAAVGSLFQRAIVLFSMATAVITYSPWLFLLLLVCTIPAFLGESQFALKGYALSHELTPIRRELDYLRVLGSSREGAKELKIFGLERYLQERYRELSKTLIQRNTRLARTRLGWGAALAALGSIGYYGSYVFLVWETVEGRITVGTLAFLSGAIASSNSELQVIFSLLSAMSEQALFLTDLLTFFEVKPRIFDKPSAIPGPRSIREGFACENVSYGYPGSDAMVLRDLNLRIYPDENVAIVGENGTGKTTLVKLLARLYEPSAGRITLDGVDIRDFKIEDLRSAVGVIFQDFMRYDMSVRDNIATGRMELRKNEPELWEALTKAGAKEVIDELPNKLEQMLGRRFEGGQDLSGGQWQRIALARAYLRNAQLLILDEPTAALDAVAEQQVFEKFAELTQDRMAILISHRFSTVRMVDRIVVLAGGSIEEEGTHDALLASGGRYSQMFELQAANYR
jgi:ATP-binding cassette, subfamily B, bacterial